MNQFEIARITNISQSQVSKILNGKPIGKTTAKKLSKVTGEKWNNIIIMKPEEIKRILDKTLKE